jgi:uncharacterized protein YggU (UPF0235/DUF167 family)
VPDPAARPAQIAVRAHPRAARDEVGPMVDGVLQVRVTRPAADGQANAAVRRLLADALGLAASRLHLVAGERARVKRFEVDGMEPAELRARIHRIGNRRN